MERCGEARLTKRRNQSGFFFCLGGQTCFRLFLGAAWVPSTRPPPARNAQKLLFSPVLAQVLWLHGRLQHQAVATHTLPVGNRASIDVPDPESRASSP